MPFIFENLIAYIKTALCADDMSAKPAVVEVYGENHVYELSYKLKAGNGLEIKEEKAAKEILKSLGFERDLALSLFNKSLSNWRWHIDFVDFNDAGRDCSDSKRLNRE